MANTSSRFTARKQQILQQLEVPEGEYHDLSPKGSVDEPIRELIDELNTLEGLVTTSSCSGRISVFLEGRKSAQDNEQIEDSEKTRAGPGGKGGGGAWLFISHIPMDRPNVESTSSLSTQFGVLQSTEEEQNIPPVNSRYIHLKFEPMILHILTASTTHAQRILTAALSAGFRESGAVSLSTTKDGDSTPMVAVRSTGYSFDSIIGYQDDQGRNVALVDERYLRTLVDIANDRFRINAERIARFRSAVVEVFQSSGLSSGAAKKADWEDADERKRRKRAEGLARQQALQVQKGSQMTESSSHVEDFDTMLE